MAMKKKIWVKKISGLEQENKADLEYYLAMTPEERLDIVQLLRDVHVKFTGARSYEDRKGLRRSIKIVERK